jgi:hypothetical protein
MTLKAALNAFRAGFLEKFPVEIAATMQQAIACSSHRSGAER